MLTRRLFATCALCSLGGFAATEVADAIPAPIATTPGVKRRIIQQTDGPIDGFTTILVEAEVPANAVVAWHTHPGIESSYILEGGGELMVKGRPNRKVAAGDGVQIPVAVPHSLKNGDKVTRLSGTYVVEKGKPLSSPASPG